jgi:hypothetical protein
MQHIKFRSLQRKRPGCSHALAATDPLDQPTVALLLARRRVLTVRLRSDEAPRNHFHSAFAVVGNECANPVLFATVGFLAISAACDLATLANEAAISVDTAHLTFLTVRGASRCAGDAVDTAASVLEASFALEAVVPRRGATSGNGAAAAILLAALCVHAVRWSRSGATVLFDPTQALRTAGGSFFAIRRRCHTSFADQSAAPDAAALLGAFAIRRVCRNACLASPGAAPLALTFALALRGVTLFASG